MLPEPYTLPNGQPVQERILLYGAPGVGKTHQYFVIAKWHQDLGSDARFYGISTDLSYDVLHSNPEFCDLKNIEWINAIDFQDYLNSAKKYNKILRPQDWLSCDLMDHGWAAAQEEYARARAKETGSDIEDMADMWIEGSTTSYPIEGWDWGMINGRYRVLANSYLLRGLGHRMIVCGAKKLLEESKSGKTDEDPTAKGEFGHVGYKPSGQKDDMWRYHSVIFVQSGGPRKQKVITAKERFGYREYMGQEMQSGTWRGVAIEDFFVDYLVKVAGWKM